MKIIKAKITEATIFTTTISIDDEEAMNKCLMRNFTGYNANHALQIANNKLNYFGYQVEME